MLLQLLDEVIACLGLPLLTEYDGGLDHHAADIVWDTCDGTLYDGRMRHESTLHLERADAVAGTLDDIIDTTLKPVVAVLVAPCHIACVINAVVPGLARLLVVAVVALEQTDGLLVAHTYHNLALLTILAGGAVGTQQVDVILGVGDTH